MVECFVMFPNLRQLCTHRDKNLKDNRSRTYVRGGLKNACGMERYPRTRRRTMDDYESHAEGSVGALAYSSST